jgi:cytochrome b
MTTMIAPVCTAETGAMIDQTTSEATMNTAGSTGKVRVWDPLVRIFHWSLVASFAVAWLSAEELSTVHEIAGYTIAGLVALRLVWGLVGSRYARFTQFIKGPGATMAYLGDMLRGKERRYLGHNPAGAAMVLALLMALSATAFTGWLLKEPARLSMLPDLPQIVAPAYADDDGDGYGGSSSELIEEMHETFANLMLLLVALHVGGVVLASFRHHENLPRAMITGEKRVPGPDDIA